MSIENLSEEQVARYGRFVGDPTPQELEEFFRLDETALEFARTKRRGYNRPGWAVQRSLSLRLGAVAKGLVPDVACRP